jgi:hypothetical protein
VKDLDKDGKEELLLNDDLYSYFESLCYACSPGVEIAVRYRNGKLTLDLELTKKLDRLVKKKPKPTEVFLDTAGQVRFKDEERASNTINHFLHSLYTGRLSEGKSLLDRYFRYKTPAAKKALYERLMAAAHNSRFRKEIEAANSGQLP